MILGLDPGPEQSAIVLFEPSGPEIVRVAHWPNEELLAWLRRRAEAAPADEVLVIERVMSFGMPVGVETFETVYWTGRYAQVWLEHHLALARVPRLQVKQALCHDSRAKDCNIRQALLDRFGHPGTRRQPGVLYGIRRDQWSALAVAVAWWDQATHG